MIRRAMEEGTCVTSGAITIRTVRVDDASISRVTFGVGACWSEDIGRATGAVLCPRPHLALITHGRLRVRMYDGKEDSFSVGDVMQLPPGHDVWTEGEEPCVFVEFAIQGETTA